MKKISWNMQLIGCQRKGAEAFKAGLPKSSCPYCSRPKNNLTRQRREYWLHGWELAATNRI